MLKDESEGGYKPAIEEATGLSRYYSPSTIINYWPNWLTPRSNSHMSICGCKTYIDMDDLHATLCGKRRKIVQDIDSELCAMEEGPEKVKFEKEVAYYKRGILINDNKDRKHEKDGMQLMNMDAVNRLMLNMMGSLRLFCISLAYRVHVKSIKGRAVKPHHLNSNIRVIPSGTLILQHMQYAVCTRVKQYRILTESLCPIFTVRGDVKRGEKGIKGKGEDKTVPNNLHI